MKMPVREYYKGDKVYKTQTLDSCTFVYHYVDNHNGYPDYYCADINQYLYDRTDCVRLDLLAALMAGMITYLEYGDSRTNVKCRIYYDKHGNIIKKYSQPLAGVDI